MPVFTALLNATRTLAAAVDTEGTAAGSRAALCPPDSLGKTCDDYAGSTLPLPRAVQAHEQFGDDVDSMLAYLLDS